MSDSERPGVPGIGGDGDGTDTPYGTRTVSPEGAAEARARAWKHEASRRRWTAAGRALGVAGCLAAMAAGAAFGHFYWGSDTIHQMVNQHGLGMVANLVTGKGLLHVWTPEEQFPARTTMNVLVLGVDHDYDNKDRVIKTSRGRSDSILLARVDFVNKRIDALTIPRDTAVRIPDRRGIHKINAAHNFGGPELTMATIKEVFGVDSDACVVVNFEGFQQIVDAIGGIDVNVSKKLDYDDNWGNLHIHLKPGYQHLNGYKAMGFVRMRHSDSDEMRSKRQHEFLEAMRTKIKQPSTFEILPAVVDRLTDNLKTTNMTRDQLFALMNFARTIPRENINLEVLPSYEGPSYVTVDTEKSAQVIQRLFFPNQAVALNIDAPNASSVRVMNAPYERGTRKRHGKRAEGAHAPAPAPARDDSGGSQARTPAEGLSVEPSQPAPPPSESLPPPADTEKPDAGAEHG